LFLDWVDDLPALLAALDIFVSASHSESFGLAILEAMASRTPVVATETEGARELLRDHQTGLLVPVKDPVKLAEALDVLLSDREQSAALAASAQEIAEKQFSLAEMIDKTESLYREILGPD
jgi:glycosyltransferase involved in cell wall biosynthesis